MKQKTKEEKFLIAVYEAALATGNIENSVDRYEVGQKIGLHPRGINTICNELAQANFIKKRGSEEVAITSNGITLIQRLKDEN